MPAVLLPGKVKILPLQHTYLEILSTTFSHCILSGNAKFHTKRHIFQLDTDVKTFHLLLSG